MAYWPTSPRFRREQFFITRRNERYSLLNQYVFNPLSQDAANIAGDLVSPEILELNNLDDILNSPHFPEAREHFKMDLTSEVLQPEELSNQINQYNRAVDDFLNQTIPGKIRQVFGEMADVTLSRNIDDLPERAILLPFMIDYLRKYWLSDGKNNLGTSYENGVLSEGHRIRTLARIPQEINSIVTGKINTLKADRGIIATLNGNLTQHGLRS